jgi:2-iminobutanoate/2-iminopropanoate deaminase
VTHSAVQTDNAPKPVGAYSQGRVAGPFVFTAGMGALDPKTGEVLARGDVAAQTGIVLDHLAAILAEAGKTFADVVKVTVHLADLHRDFPAYNAVYQSRFSEPFPTRTTVGSTLAEGILVEIDVVAYSD